MFRNFCSFSSFPCVSLGKCFRMKKTTLTAEKSVSEWNAAIEFSSLSKISSKNLHLAFVVQRTKWDKTKKRSDTVPMTLYHLIVNAIRQFIQNKINLLLPNAFNWGSLSSVPCWWRVLWRHEMRESLPGQNSVKLALKSKLERRHCGTQIDADETMYQYDCVLSNLARFSFFHLIYRHFMYSYELRVCRTSEKWKWIRDDCHRMGTDDPKHLNETHVYVFTAEKYKKFSVLNWIVAEYFSKSPRDTEIDVTQNEDSRTKTKDFFRKIGYEFSSCSQISAVEVWIRRKRDSRFSNYLLQKSQIINQLG